MPSGARRWTPRHAVKPSATLNRRALRGATNVIIEGQNTCPRSYCVAPNVLGGFGLRYGLAMAAHDLAAVELTLSRRSCGTAGPPR
jgi:hypothetical protein